MTSKHKCYWNTYGATANSRRVFRICKNCWRKEYRDNDEWRLEITLKGFVEKWLPAISGTHPEKMMTIQVGYPFEWDCYESWNSVFRVRFDFRDVMGRQTKGLGTLVDVMNGWMSPWRQDLNLIDLDANDYYKKRTGRDYRTGDNTYFEMRQAIQS